MEYQDLLKLAALIAHSMPTGWRVDRRPIEKDRQHQGARIVGDHFKAIRLYQSYHSKGKVTIRGECPDYGLTWKQRHYAYLPSSSPSINVSPTRNPRHIAADIQRRLLPDYDAMLVKTQQAAQDYRHKIEQLGYVDHAFRSVMPSLRAYQDNTHNTERRYYLHGNEDESFRHGELTVSTYQCLHCDLTLSDVSIETAIKIMSLIRENPAS